MGPCVRRDDLQGGGMGAAVAASPKPRKVSRRLPHRDFASLFFQFDTRPWLSSQACTICHLSRPLG
jgi:hypothetical protein